MNLKDKFMAGKLNIEISDCSRIEELRLALDGLRFNSGRILDNGISAYRSSITNGVLIRVGNAWHYKTGGKALFFSDRNLTKEEIVTIDEFLDEINTSVTEEDIAGVFENAY